MKSFLKLIGCVEKCLIIYAWSKIFLSCLDVEQFFASLTKTQCCLKQNSLIWTKHCIHIYKRPRKNYYMLCNKISLAGFLIYIYVSGTLLYMRSENKYYNISNKIFALLVFDSYLERLILPNKQNKNPRNKMRDIRVNSFVWLFYLSLICLAVMIMVGEVSACSWIWFYLRKYSENFSRLYLL